MQDDTRHPQRAQILSERSVPVRPSARSEHGSSRASEASRGICTYPETYLGTLQRQERGFPRICRKLPDRSVWAERSLPLHPSKNLTLWMERKGAPVHDVRPGEEQIRHLSGASGRFGGLPFRRPTGNPAFPRDRRSDPRSVVGKGLGKCRSLDFARDDRTASEGFCLPRPFLIPSFLTPSFPHAFPSSPSER